MKLINIQRLACVACVISVALIMGCASTKGTGDPASMTEEQFNLEELLGEADQQQAADQQTQAAADEEGEVLRLLGITKEEKPETATGKLTQEEQTTTATNQANELQTQIEDLEKKIESKDIEIATLKSDLAVKEEKVGQLEQELTALRTAPATTTKTATGAAPTTFKGKYQVALEAYEKKQYREALTQFETLLNENPNNSLSDNCQYWIGECYYGLGDYNQSIMAFQRVFTFENTNKAADAQLKLGLCHLQLGDKVRAKEEFQRVVFDYPDSEYVALAQNYINRL